MNEIASLRAQVRRTRLTAFAALAVATALPLLALGPASSMLRADRIEAREIDLVDAGGNAVLSLRADDGGRVTLMRPDGEVVLELGESAGTNTVLRVRDRAARGWGVLNDDPRPAAMTDREETIGAVDATTTRAGDVRLRPLEWASEADRRAAFEIASRGWVYVMPKPKSNRARWGYTHGSTTWFNGYWKNTDSGRTSETAPVATNNFAGDGVEVDEWRRGGSPDAPSIIEWLCSEEGGIEPARD